MPLTPNFTDSQTQGNPSVITLADTSTGSDVSITERRVFLIDQNGNYIKTDGNVNDYTVWALVDTEIDIDCLKVDMALNITVNWVNVSGVTIETKTKLSGFTLYNEQFYYNLTTKQSSDPRRLDNENYLKNKSALRNYIDSGNQALIYGNDIKNAQLSYDKATFLSQNETSFF